MLFWHIEIWHIYIGVVSANQIKNATKKIQKIRKQKFGRNRKPGKNQKFGQTLKFFNRPIWYAIFNSAFRQGNIRCVKYKPISFKKVSIAQLTILVINFFTLFNMLKCGDFIIVYICFHVKCCSINGIPFGQSLNFAVCHGCSYVPAN